MTLERTAAAVRMRGQEQLNFGQIARVLGNGMSSVSRALAKHDATEDSASMRLEAKTDE